MAGEPPHGQPRIDARRHIGHAVVRRGEHDAACRPGRGHLHRDAGAEAAAMQRDVLRIEVRASRHPVVELERVAHDRAFRRRAAAAPVTAVVHEQDCPLAVERFDFRCERECFFGVAAVVEHYRWPASWRQQEGTLEHRAVACDVAHGLGAPSHGRARFPRRRLRIEKEAILRVPDDGQHGEVGADEREDGERHRATAGQALSAAGPSCPSGRRPPRGRTAAPRGSPTR